MKPNQQKEAMPIGRDDGQFENPTPRRIDRKRGAALITDRYFQISPRTLEKWPIAWRYANGRATCETEELLNYAKSKLDAAPAIKGGPGPTSLPPHKVPPQTGQTNENSPTTNT